MKQIEKNTLCYYCLGCNKQADTDYLEAKDEI